MLPVSILEEHHRSGGTIIRHRNDGDIMSARVRKRPIFELFFGESLNLSKGTEGELKVFEVAGLTPGDGIMGDVDEERVGSHSNVPFV